MCVCCLYAPFGDHALSLRTEFHLQPAAALSRVPSGFRTQTAGYSIRSLGRFLSVLHGWKYQKVPLAETVVLYSFAHLRAPTSGLRRLSPCNRCIYVTCPAAHSSVRTRVHLAHLLQTIGLLSSITHGGTARKCRKSGPTSQTISMADRATHSRRLQDGECGHI